jgi:hypothetical protein
LTPEIGKGRGRLPQPFDHCDKMWGKKDVAFKEPAKTAGALIMNFSAWPKRHAF